MGYLNQLIEGYNSPMVLEECVGLGNSFSISGTCLGVLVSFVDAKHNSEMGVLIDSYWWVDYGFVTVNE